MLDDTGVHLLRNNPNKIEDGLNINIYATTVNQTFAEQWFSIYERTVPSPYKTNHNTPIIIMCKNDLQEMLKENPDSTYT